MSRVFEVVEAIHTVSRLTVTPTRVTLKIHPDHSEYTERLTNAATRITKQTDYPLALRGAFDFDKGVIHMYNGKLKRIPYLMKHRDNFVYTIDGELITKVLNKGKKEAEE